MAQSRDCEDFRELIERYVTAQSMDGSISQDEYSALLNHMDKCEGCEQFYDGLEAAQKRGLLMQAPLSSDNDDESDFSFGEPDPNYDGPRLPTTAKERLMLSIVKRKSVVVAFASVLGTALLACVVSVGAGVVSNPIFDLPKTWEVTSVTPYQATGQILHPLDGSIVGSRFKVSGTLGDVAEGWHVWIAVKRGNLFWPKEPEIEPDENGNWEMIAYEGGSPGELQVSLLLVDEPGHKRILDWFADSNSTGRFPGLSLNELDAKELNVVDDLELK